MTPAVFARSLEGNAAIAPRGSAQPIFLHQPPGWWPVESFPVGCPVYRGLEAPSSSSGAGLGILALGPRRRPPVIEFHNARSWSGALALIAIVVALATVITSFFRQG